LIRFLKDLLWRWRAPDDRVVIDQAAYYDRLEAEARRRIEMERAIEREREQISIAVGSWARDTVRNRSRVAIPRVVKREISAWLPGLNAREVMNLAAASAFDTRHHLFALWDTPIQR
jgi:hypothetical protein